MTLFFLKSCKIKRDSVYLALLFHPLYTAPMSRVPLVGCLYTVTIFTISSGRVSLPSNTPSSCAFIFIFEACQHIYHPMPPMRSTSIPGPMTIHGFSSVFPCLKFEFLFLQRFPPNLNLAQYHTKFSTGT